MIVGDDKADALPLRRATRAAHVAYLKQLVDQGRLILAGPRPCVDAVDPGDAGYHGSLIVAEFDSLAEAQAWAESDPYRIAGVFSQVRVQPFVKALP
jgi:uncharacterized protein YciI